MHVEHNLERFHYAESHQLTERRQSHGFHACVDRGECKYLRLLRNVQTPVSNHPVLCGRLSCRPEKQTHA